MEDFHAGRDRWPSVPYAATSSFDVFRPQSARVTTAKRLPCVRVDGTWFRTGGVKGSAMTVGGLDMCGCSEYARAWETV